MRSDIGDYTSVNNAWDGVTVTTPTPTEAIRAARRLYRKWMGRAYTGKWKTTSGNRHTWERYGVFSVNTDSWDRVVHGLSHWVHRRLHPGEEPHHHTHAVIESEMREYMAAEGWLEGRLRPAEKPPVDPAAVRYARACAAIERWERKRKRAETALRKLRRRKAYYERKGVASARAR